MKENVAKKITIVVVIAIISLIMGLLVFNFAFEPTKSQDIIVEEEKEVEKDPEIDDFYLDYTGYTDVRKLPQNYSIEEARQDSCYTVGLYENYNENLYQRFLEKVQKNEYSQLRVAKAAEDDKLVLIDIKYNAIDGNVTLVIDESRDGREQARIEEYEHIGEYNFSENIKCFVAYNGELNEETYASDATYVIAILN